MPKDIAYWKIDAQMQYQSNQQKGLDIEVHRD